jgi:hypothetical protein
VFAAFEIATELLRHPSLAGDAALPKLREHVDSLLLLAHFRPDMLKHSCRDIAAAAILNAHRVQGTASSNQLTAITSASVLACAAHMATICSSRQAMLADYPTSSLGR